MNLLFPARFPDESFEDYKARRSKNNLWAKLVGKGRALSPESHQRHEEKLTRREEIGKAESYR